MDGLWTQKFSDDSKVPPFIYAGQHGQNTADGGVIHCMGWLDVTRLRASTRALSLTIEEGLSSLVPSFSIWISGFQVQLHWPRACSGGAGFGECSDRISFSSVV